MEEVTIYRRSSDDQSVSDIKDEKASETAEGEHSGHKRFRFRYLASYRKKPFQGRVSTSRDADNAAKPDFKPRRQLSKAKRALSENDLSRFFIRWSDPFYRKQPFQGRGSTSRYAGNAAKPEFKPRRQLSKVKRDLSDDDPSKCKHRTYQYGYRKKPFQGRGSTSRYTGNAAKPEFKPRRQLSKVKRETKSSIRFTNKSDDESSLSLDTHDKETEREENRAKDCVEKHPVSVTYDKHTIAASSGGHPSDGDPSSDHESERNRKKSRNWVVDHYAWKNCSEKDFQTEAECLLLDGKLPTQALLDEACVRHKRTNPGVQSICKSICCYIKEKSKSFLDVWAAYRYNKDDTSYGNKVVFVILTDSTHDVEITEFETYKRNIIEITSKKENDAIKIKENEDPPSSLEIECLESCLKDNAKSQIERHSNLTRVTASWYQSSGYGTEKFKLQRLPCIALYVHVKGYVPLDEEPFSSEIGKHPVDVREGVSILCGKPYEYHQNVKMGCAIRGASLGDTFFAGTLGPFLEFKDDRDLYAISCAHVFFHGESWKYITESNQIACYINAPAFQPPLADNRTDLFGNVEMTVFKNGGNGYPGMEIALIKINPWRYPDTGTFPDDFAHSDGGFGPLEFYNGRCCLSEHLSFNRSVYKYGCTTGQTMGKCRINGASVRTRVMRDNLHTIVLHDQIEIEQVNDIPFAAEGDSGAVVLTDHGNERIAVGILEGKDEDVYLMTPISPILKELERLRDRGCRLKKFETYNQPVVDPRFDERGLKQTLEEKFETQRKDLRNEFASYSNQIELQMQQGFKNMSEDLNKQLASIQNTFQSSQGHNSS